LLENATLDPNTNVPNANDVFYKGTNMGDVTHQETYSHIVFKENNVVKDIFKSISDPDRNIIRIQIDTPAITIAKPQGMQRKTLARPRM
jgi:arabinogalactan endo-1,4-beta-galactosidase